MDSSLTMISPTRLQKSNEMEGLHEIDSVAIRLSLTLEARIFSAEVVRCVRIGYMTVSPVLAALQLLSMIFSDSAWGVKGPTANIMEPKHLHQSVLRFLECIRYIPEFHES